MIVIMVVVVRVVVVMVVVGMIIGVIIRMVVVMVIGVVIIAAVIETLRTSVPRLRAGGKRREKFERERGRLEETMIPRLITSGILAAMAVPR